MTFFFEKNPYFENAAFCQGQRHCYEETKHSLMALEVVKFSYLSEFLYLPVYRIDNNKRIGRLVDFAASTTQVYPRITGLLVQTARGKPPKYIPWTYVKRFVFKEQLAVELPPEGTEFGKAAENEILVKKNFFRQADYFNQRVQNSPRERPAIAHRR